MNATMTERQIALQLAADTRHPDHGGEEMVARALIFYEFLMGKRDEAARKLLADNAELREAGRKEVDGRLKDREMLAEQLRKLADQISAG